MKKNSKEVKLLEQKHSQRMLEIDMRMSEANRMGDLRRARSLNVGTAFGGTTEVLMRCNDGTVAWAVLQPVETAELIHQLASNIGCHIHIQPRTDFASWRDWKYNEEQLAHYRGVQHLPGVGHPPIVHDMPKEVINLGAKLPPPEQQAGLNALPSGQSKIENERKEHEPVAIEKTVKRRNTKRTATTT